jgi:hypothetical protein
VPTPTGQLHLIMDVDEPDFPLLIGLKTVKNVVYNSLNVEKQTPVSQSAKCRCWYGGNGTYMLRGPETF